MMRSTGKTDIFVRLANPVRRNPDGSWDADNFDGVGFIGVLKAAGHQIAGKRVLPVGAGWLIQVPYAHYLRGNPIKEG